MNFWYYWQLKFYHNFALTCPALNLHSEISMVFNTAILNSSEAIFTLVKFITIIKAKMSAIVTCDITAVLTLATLGNMTKIEPNLSVLHRLRKPRHVGVVISPFHIALTKYAYVNEPLSCVYISKGYTIMLSLSPATATWNSTCLVHLGHSNINRNNPICVALPKVAKASTISVTVTCIIAGRYRVMFANVNET